MTEAASLKGKIWNCCCRFGDSLSAPLNPAKPIIGGIIVKVSEPTLHYFFGIERRYHPNELNVGAKMGFTAIFKDAIIDGFIDKRYNPKLNSTMKAIGNSAIVLIFAMAYEPSK